MKKKKAAARPARRLTEAEKNDRAIAAYDRADKELEAAAAAREAAKNDVIRRSRRCGVPDGQTLQLTGRRYRCSVTEGLHLSLTPSALKALNRVPKKWRVTLVRIVRELELKKTVRVFIRNPAQHRDLPKTVKAFLRAVGRTRDYTVKVKEGK